MMQPDPSQTPLPAERPMNAAELRLMLTLVVGPALLVLVGSAMVFTIVILCAVFGPQGRYANGVPLAEDPQLEFLRANDCVVADVRGGQARLYRCDPGDGPVHLTPDQVRQQTTAQPLQEDPRGAI